MTTTTPWSHTPWREPGTYHVKRWDGQEMTAIVYEKDGQLIFETSLGARFLCESGLEELYRFGPRVLSAEETVKQADELETLKDRYCELVVVHDNLTAEVATLRGAMAAQIERERVAGERCGVPYEQHGCDWLEWVADEVLKLRAENAALREKLASVESVSVIGSMVGPFPQPAKRYMAGGQSVEFDGEVIAGARIDGIDVGHDFPTMPYGVTPPPQTSSGN